MAGNIIVPPLGESVSEATIAKWHKKVGDSVKVDELIVELETDKVTLEVNAPITGKLDQIVAQVGQSVKVGELLGNIKTGQTANDIQDPTAEIKSAPVLPSKSIEASTIASPAANKIAADRGIDLNSLEGTGREGRITKGDVLKGNVVEAAAAGPKEERVRMTKLRKTIALRLKESQNTAAILSTFNEVDMKSIFEIRAKYQDSFKEQHGVKLGFMSFFVKAVVSALKEIPAVNAEIDGDDIVYKNYYDIGIAVGTDQGLVVPVLRNADKLSLAEIESAINELGKKAREGKLSMADMSGATFTITNGGTYGSLLSTPIINPPQSGILGMHNIVKRPVVVDDQVVIRPMMYIALSYDHRIIDGKEAVTFLVKVKQIIEDPLFLLLK